MRSLCLYSAGSNARGQLAIGNIDDVHQFTPCIFLGCVTGALPNHATSIQQIECGANHTLVLLRLVDGETALWGCGDGRRGQLGPSYPIIGNDEYTAIFRPLDLDLADVAVASPEQYTVRLIAAGWETSYVVLSCPERSDVVLSMGADDFGSLGVGVGCSTASKPRINAIDLSDIVPSESGRSGAVVKILTLCSGPRHTVARVCITPTNGSSPETVLVGWGASRHGQLGPLLGASGRPTPFIFSPQTVPLPTPENISMIALGNQHSVFLRTPGELSCLGSNLKGQIDQLDSLCGVVQVGCTWNGTYALFRSGTVVATGSDTHSQLGGGRVVHGALSSVQFPFDLALGQVSRLTCGSEHVLCIVDFCVSAEGERNYGRALREVWGWGWNEHGNLGTGSTDDVVVPTRIWPPRPRPHAHMDGTSGEWNGDVVDVWAGCGTSWVLVERRH